jgi:starch synthase
MNILIAAAEAWPYIKVGGLGDVVGALPKALKKCGADARIIMPQYRDIPVLLKKEISHKADFYIDLGWRRQYCGINQVEYNGSMCYFIDNEYYFGRNGVYGHYDDGERFAFFSKAVLEVLPFLDFKPDIIHCNDWHTAFIPVLLEKQYKSRDFYSHIKTLYTIHNLSYQGVMPSGTLMNLLGIGTDEKIEYYGNESISKGGLIYSDGISAVSPSYAREIQESSMGEGLDGVLRKRSDKLKGILNGIDYEVYNPENDQYIFQCYCKSHIDRRKANKLELQRELELQEKEDVPLIGMVSRLVSQKGFQLVEQVLEDILAMDVQLVVLGSGEKKYEDMFINAACMHKDKAAVSIGFSEKLAHRIYAGADMFLMPSLIEPCGLGQLIALRYGAIPIVRKTGGLKDTVFHFNAETGEGNGFYFSGCNPQDMLQAVVMAVEIYKNNESWLRLQQNAMSCDYSWERSAYDYAELYQSLMQ